MAVIYGSIITWLVLNIYWIQPKLLTLLSLKQNKLYNIYVIQIINYNI